MGRALELSRLVMIAHGIDPGDQARLVSISCGLQAALRAAQGPLTSLDIARQVVAVRKLDGASVTVIRKRVGAALWKLRAKGMVAEVPQAGDYKGWRLSGITERS